MKRITMLLVAGILLLCSMVFALVPSVAEGAVPQLINFQGILKDGSGNPVANGSYSVIITVYDAPSGGSVFWAETTSVSTASGLFTTLLGADNPLPDSVFNDSSRYLGVKVGADPEMTPRQRLVSGAYSLRVAHFIPDYGTANTFIGQNAGNQTMTGFYNTASGLYALYSNTSGSYNTASGVSALLYNTSGSDNTASGTFALLSNTYGSDNTASGYRALFNNTGGNSNTAIGYSALSGNTTGFFNTAIGYGANVAISTMTNATAIGANAIVNASDKIRLGNSFVTVIEGQVAYTFTSDKNQKENFRPVDGEEVLRKIRGFELSSWNYKGHDPKQFRHYGPMAQDFFAAFGNDGVGKIGTETTLNSGDVAGILMIAVQTLGKENERMKAENQDLRKEMKELRELVQILLAKEEGTSGQTYTLNQELKGGK